MSRASGKAREVLLDTAEELFARCGIDAVSNRKIAEQAGTANHSAINYHFGSREGLLAALIQRAVDDALRFQDRLAARGRESDADLRELVTVRTMPWVYSFEAASNPSWRARFLFQARLHLDLPEVVGDSLAEGILEAAAHGRVRAELAGIPELVVRSRVTILGPMVLGICAQYESTVNEGQQRGNWESLGYFLVDSIVGMLAAPSTSPADFMDFDKS